MNSTFTFIIISLAIFIVFMSLGIMIFGITVIIQHASGLPPIPYQSVNWTIGVLPFP
jgi:hypothetical protein